MIAVVDAVLPFCHVAVHVRPASDTFGTCLEHGKLGLY